MMTIIVGKHWTFGSTTRPEILIKYIALALFLLALGSMSLLLAFFIFTGLMGGETSQAYSLLALGFLAFLPGFYQTRIAYYSWRGAKCIASASIPD